MTELLLAEAAKEKILGDGINAVIDKFLLPKIATLPQILKKEIDEDDIPDLMAQYIEKSYKKIGYVNTIVFKNQQKHLDELYIPITICKQREMETYCIKVDSDAYNNLEEYEKILIVDLAGMGKSTALKYLYLRAVEQNQGIPVFIELRSLRSDRKILDYILEEITPILDNDVSKEAIQYLIEEGDFIFFLDGYDEITLSEKSDVTNDIEQFISKAHKNTFIMSSRDESELTCFGQFQRFNIRKLKKEEAFNLIRKYDNNSELSEELIKKINEDTDLKLLEEFLCNPLMVSLLYKAYIHKKTIPNKKPIFYRQVYDALFQDHDLSKGGCYEHEKKSKLDIEDFHRVLRALGYISFFKYRKVTYGKQELIDIINECRKKVPELVFNTNDFLLDILGAVPLMYKDGNEFKWVHKSFQEYFAACYVKQDEVNKIDTIKKIAFSKKNGQNYNVLDFYYDLDIKCFEEVVIYPVVCDYLEHIKNNQNVAEISEMFCNELFIYQSIWFLTSQGDNINTISVVRNKRTSETIKKDFTVQFCIEPQFNISVLGYENTKYFTIKRLLKAKTHETVQFAKHIGICNPVLARKIFDLFIAERNKEQELNKSLLEEKFNKNDLKDFIDVYTKLFCRDDNTYFSKDACQLFKEKIEKRLEQEQITDEYDF